MPLTIFNSNGDGLREEVDALLPTREDTVSASIPPKEVTKVALRLKHQIESVIPCELEEEQITKALSPILTQKVVATAKQAGGEEYKACVVYCLLVNKQWFKRQAQIELWDADLHNLRGLACEILAKRIIEAEEDTTFLLEQVLLQRFSIYIGDGEDSVVANVIERAVDLHALNVIGSSGYQKCVSYLWRGWLTQDDDDPTRFVPYNDRSNTSYWAHLNPDRMRVPRYQNALEVTFSVIFLGLYTGAINTINPSGDLDPVETLLYLFTVGFMCDEASKFFKVGRYYLSFWNVFNSTLYALLTVSFITRMIALAHANEGDDKAIRKSWNKFSYNFLAFTAPMFWMRLMLYFDTFQFFGAMLVVVKMMMKESIIFFALLFFVLVGFFQGFIGMDLVDEQLDTANYIIANMANAILSSPDFDGFDNFAPPFGLILYYIFTFVIMVVLLNILIALYNSAYEDVSSNATDEYMALFAQKCLQFVRAPDENVFIPPLNLIEIFGLIIPLEWWVGKKQYNKINDYVMLVLYAPFLTVTAFIEQSQARRIRSNRKRGEEDEDTTEIWERMDWKPEDQDEDWCDKVEKSVPNIKGNEAVLGIEQLQKETKELREMVQRLLDAKNK